MDKTLKNDFPMKLVFGNRHGPLCEQFPTGNCFQKLVPFGSKNNFHMKVGRHFTKTYSELWRGDTKHKDKTSFFLGIKRLMKVGTHMVLWRLLLRILMCFSLLLFFPLKLFSLGVWCVTSYNVLNCNDVV